MVVGCRLSTVDWVVVVVVCGGVWWWLCLCLCLIARFRKIEKDSKGAGGQDITKFGKGGLRQHYLLYARAPQEGGPPRRQGCAVEPFLIIPNPMLSVTMTANQGQSGDAAFPIWTWRRMSTECVLVIGRGVADWMESD